MLAESSPLSGLFLDWTHPGLYLAFLVYFIQLNRTDGFWVDLDTVEPWHHIQLQFPLIAKLRFESRSLIMWQTNHSVFFFVLYSGIWSILFNRPLSLRLVIVIGASLMWWAHTHNESILDFHDWGPGILPLTYAAIHKSSQIWLQSVITTKSGTPVHTIVHNIRVTEPWRKGQRLDRKTSWHRTGVSPRVLYLKA